MPRGIYDRSKMKNPAKKVEAPAAKQEGKKRGRKAKADLGAVGSPSQEKAAVAAPSVGLGRGNGQDLYSIRENLNTLTNTRASVIGPLGDPYTTGLTGMKSDSTRGILVTKLDALITKVVDQFDATLFPVKIEAIEESIPAPAPSASKNGTTAATPAPVAQAPVAFNPPTFTQPQS